MRATPPAIAAAGALAIAAVRASRVRPGLSWATYTTPPSPERASRTFMPVLTCSASGVTLIRFPRTLVPSQSTTAAT